LSTLVDVVAITPSPPLTTTESFFSTCLLLQIPIAFLLSYSTFTAITALPAALPEYKPPLPPSAPSTQRESTMWLFVRDLFLSADMYYYRQSVEKGRGTECLWEELEATRVVVGCCDVCFAR
jgi:hypothetical protein